MSYQVLGGLKVILSKVLEASFLKTIGPFEEGQRSLRRYQSW